MRRSALATFILVFLLAPPVQAQIADWLPQSHPLEIGARQTLEDVAAIRENNVWAVGNRFFVAGDGYNFRARALHWNGYEWTETEVADPNAVVSRFHGVDGVAGRNGPVWAVGYYRRHGEISKGLIERWNGPGIGWSIDNIPALSGTGATLDAVHVIYANNVWAVGSTYVYERGYPLVLQWDGVSWNKIEVPASRLKFCTGSTTLTDVTALTAGRVLVSGYCTSGRGAARHQQAFIMNWNGSIWSLPVGPHNLKTDFHTYLESVTVIDKQLWAAGMSTDDTGKGKPLLLRRVNNVWTETDTSHLTDINSVHGIAGDTHDNVWAVGAGTSISPPFVGPVSLHWNGNAWEQVTVPADFSRLYAVDVAPLTRKTWAVGFNLDDSLIFWREDPSPPPP